MFLLSLPAYALPVLVEPLDLGRPDLEELELAGPHARHAAEFGATPHFAQPPQRGFLPIPSPGPDMTVYGYLAYWEDDLDSVAWDDITHLAIFSAGANDDGSLYDTWKWDIADEAVAMAAPYGVKVHLVVTNFNPTSLQTLLASSTNRNNLIDELVDWQAQTGADGVNIDFEGLPYAVKTQMVTFTADLEAAVGEVVLAGPSVDWAGAWDYSELTRYADIFIMGYGYHWGGSSYAGPTDPLYAGSGTVWNGVQSYSVAWSIDDYVANGADPARVIMGLPLYGMSWPVSNNNVPTGTNGTGSSVFFESAWADEAQYGRSWEGDSLTPYTYGGGRQIWYGDEESVRERIAYVRDQSSIQGIGFWALHYDGDDPSFWTMIHDETTYGGTTTGGTDPGTTVDPGGTDPVGGTSGTSGTEDAPADGPFVADAGRPFLAYVGDTVVLSGVGSRGPAGADLRYTWVQIAGPAVALSAATDPEPTFVVEVPGTHVFELVVGDGTASSPPARSYLVVIDPGIPTRHLGGCGCDSTGGLAAAGLALVSLLFIRRRR